ncbi:MAG: UvrD-helicase domain-containing protein [Candidatus Babeliales bacterium]
MSTEYSSFNTFITTQLNAEQKKAVQHDAGSLLVVAGAGSGKTRVITARICNLILKNGIVPSSILALTFTNKAAKEMKERIVKFLPAGITLPFVGTFHSYCLRLLKLNRQLLEYPSFGIMDADDQEKLVSTIIKRSANVKKITAKSILYTISQIKTATIMGKSYEIFDPLINSVFEQYEREKKASHCFDFDDLLLEILKLFSTNSSFKEQFQKDVRHILVDEYQDTNAVQHALLKHMALREKKHLAIDSICVVGDEDQSIYSWRGATIENILNFKSDFEKTNVVTIEQNYRSVKQILSVANELINHNKNRNPKKLWSDKEGSNRVLLLSAHSGYQESDIISYCAQIAQRNKKLDSIAILYRTHFQSRVIEEALLRNSIPYKIIGGIQFYERKEIKDLLAYLKLIVNPFDRISFSRVINAPQRGLGDKFQETFMATWDSEPLMNFMQLANQLIDNKTITGTKAAALKVFLSVFNQNASKERPSKILDTIIATTHYLDYLKNQYEKQEAEAKIDNVKELVRALIHFEQTGIDTAQAVLEEITLMQEKMLEKDSEEQCIQLMTLHAAKGLEFDMVLLCGLEETLLPSSRSLHDSSAIEEERRLFYVGITRARERLVLTHSKYRHTYGTMTEQLPSRFISEIPTHLMHHEECSYWKSHNAFEFFNNWLGVSLAPPRAPLTFGPAITTQPTIKKTVAIKPEASTPSFGGGWRKNQPVSHPSFGIGIIEKVEKKGSETIYVTARFKAGIKKIDAQFLKKV